MFIDRADITIKLPKEVLDFTQSFGEVFETIRALIGKGDNPEEFLLRLRILQYFEDGHYEERYHTKKRVAEALDIDEIHLRESFSDFQNHDILVPNSSGSAYRLHNKAVMYLMYLKGFFIERSLLSSHEEQFLRLQELAKAMRIEDSSRKLLYRVYFDALDTIHELNEKTQTKAGVKQKEELMDFFLKLQPKVNEKLIQDFGHYQANLFFLNHVVLDGVTAILKSGIETAKHSDSSSIRRDIDPIIVEEYVKRVPSDTIVALARFHNEPVGIPSGNEQRAVNAYLRSFQEISEGIKLEELPPARSEEIVFLTGAKLPPPPPDIEKDAMAFYSDIRKYLPTNLLSIISASTLENALLRWNYVAVLAKKKIITFESGTIKERKGESYVFFEDVEVIPLLN